MLDEGLPAFVCRPSSENPLSTIIYFTHQGSEPVPEYAFKRPDLRNPATRNKYAVGLGEPTNNGVVYGEVLVEPVWQQPNLSAAEQRAQNGAPPPPIPGTPESFVIRLYNPDQQISVKTEKASWTGKESWEFEIPQTSFRAPSASKIDQDQNDPVYNELTPKILFRWKRDSKFSKDITCYLSGKSVGGRRSKEPDITIAMFRQGREPALTIYEPNLMRVEVEDRKGLEVALLLGAEVIREIYLLPSRDPFNVGGAPPAANRKNSKPVSPSNAYAMSGGLSNLPPAGRVASPVTQQPTPPQDRRQHEVDAETKRLHAEMEREKKDRERQDRAEEERIQKMLADEDRQRQQRQQEVDQETERLRRQYGMEGQDFGRPSLPPRPGAGLQAQPMWNNMQPPPRPVSAGPSHQQPMWRPNGPPGGPGMMSGGAGGPMPPYGHPGQQHYPQQPPYGQQQQGPPHGRRRGGSHDAEKIKKKRSVFF